MRSKHANRLKSEQRESVVQEYRAGASIESLAEKYGVSYNAIWGLLNRRGVPRRRVGHPVVCEIDEAVFDTLDEYAAYWVGFLMADGCVHSNTIHLGLASKDKGHLHRFRNFLGSTHSVSADRQMTGFGSGVFNQFAFRSTRISNRLKELGVRPRKSFSAEAPRQLAKNRHFWRGVVDGDGSLGVYGKGPRIGLVGSRRIAEQFLEFANSLHPTRVNVHPTCNIHSVYFNGSTAVRVVRVLYDACKIALKRKQKIAEHILKASISL